MKKLYLAVLLLLASSLYAACAVAEGENTGNVRITAESFAGDDWLQLRADYSAGPDVHNNGAVRVRYTAPEGYIQIFAYDPSLLGPGHEISPYFICFLFPSNPLYEETKDIVRNFSNGYTLIALADYSGGPCTNVQLLYDSAKIGDRADPSWAGFTSYGHVIVGSTSMRGYTSVRFAANTGGAKMRAEMSMGVVMFSATETDGSSLFCVVPPETPLFDEAVKIFKTMAVGRYLSITTGEPYAGMATCTTIQVAMSTNYVN